MLYRGAVLSMRIPSGYGDDAATTEHCGLGAELNTGFRVLEQWVTAPEAQTCVMSVCVTQCVRVSRNVRRRCEITSPVQSTQDWSLEP